MVPVAVAAFVVLGLTESGIGAAWPSLRRTVERPVADLGTLLVVGLAGYATSSAITGATVRRLGTGSSLVAAGSLSLAGLTLYATAHSWIGVLGAALLLGLGSGFLDSVLNAHAAHHFTAGAMNLLHAGFGVGATLGPLVMATAISRGSGWQAGYVIYAVVQACMLPVLVSLRSRWRPPPAGDASHRPHLPLRTAVAASLAMFFLYTGIEVTAGQWSFSVLTELRGFSTESGGVWVSAYWAGLMLGRFALSAFAGRLGPRRVLEIGIGGSVVAAAWFWLDAGGLGMLGLPALGLSLAGIFPTLVTLTPVRIGTEHTTSMVGYQLAAASLGAAALPWLTGRVIAASSLAALGPVLLVAAALLATLNTVLAHQISAGGGERPGA